MAARGSLQASKEFPTKIRVCPKGKNGIVIEEYMPELGAYVDVLNEQWRPPMVDDIRVMKNIMIIQLICLLVAISGFLVTRFKKYNPE